MLLLNNIVFLILPRFPQFPFWGQERTDLLISLLQFECLPLSRLNPPMITFPTVLFRHSDTRGLPGSSCLNEEPQAQWTESLFHNQLTTIPHVWCQWTALSILGNWLTPAQIRETATEELPWAMVSCRDAWENQGEVVWEDSSSACPRNDITIILLFLSRPKITHTPAKGYC